MELDLNQLLLGDCLEVLKTFPDDYFDSCVSDVPYGLGTKEPTPEEIIAYIQGEELDTGGDFMGKRWSIPSVNVWKEVYRVLKPGGHVLAFAGTRTWDLISLGLRSAGFEKRDTIADNHPAIQWVYGSGMPKSSNVAMNIDKALGHAVDPKNYEPISDEAKEAAHLGSGLKPSWEPILVYRKPFKGSLMKNVQAYGVGALNIDGTRVAHASKEDFENHKAQVEAVRAKGGVRGDSWKNSSDLSGANEVTAAGRWPANMVMTHHPECQLVGTKKVKGITGGSVAIRGSGPYSETKGLFTEGRQQPDRKGHADENGQESIASWQCHECCPIAELNAQSGDRPSTLTGRADPNASHAHPGTEFNENSTFLGKRTHHSNVYADSGGAARFFQQFQQELEAPFIYSTKANRKEATMGEFKVLHPTLKPVKLMQYLVRLVTPKGGKVLDPYCGSGSTCHATLLEGCFYIGIERDPKAHEEATRRMAIIHAHLDEDHHGQDMFDLMMGFVEEV